MKTISILAAVISLFIIIQVASALDIKNYSIYFDIQKNRVVRQTIAIELENVTQDTETQIVLEEFENFMIFTDNKVPPYFITIDDLGKTVHITIFNSTKEIKIIFDSKNSIYSRDNILNFFASVKPPKAEKVIIGLNLPEGWIVYDDLISPDNVIKETDGKRIQLQWNFDNPKNKVLISVSYYNPQNNNTLLFVILFLVVSVTLVCLIYKYKKKSEIELLKGFSEDEKKVIEILKANKVAYQNRIEKELKFSRAKMTRIAKKLEITGLIHRETIGRTKKIFWKK